MPKTSKTPPIHPVEKHPGKMTYPLILTPHQEQLSIIDGVYITQTTTSRTAVTELL